MTRKYINWLTLINKCEINDTDTEKTKQLFVL